MLLPLNSHVYSLLKEKSGKGKLKKKLKKYQFVLKQSRQQNCCFKSKNGNGLISVSGYSKHLIYWFSVSSLAIKDLKEIKRPWGEFALLFYS